MNNKLLLATCITLLFRESQRTARHDNSAGLVKNIIESIKLPEMSLGVGHQKEVLDGLKDTALYMANQNVDHDYGPNEIQQRVRLNCDGDDDLCNAINDGITGIMEEDRLLRTCINLRNSLRTHFADEKTKEIINKVQYQLNFGKDKIVGGTKKVIAQLINDLQPFATDTVKKDPAIIGEVDGGDIAGMTNVFDSVLNTLDGSSILRTGWQGINRMLDGGVRRGEEVVIPALQHNYKTGFSLTLFKQLAIFNTPILTNQLKKPLMVRISFEDSLDLNFQFLYQNFYQNEHGRIADMTGLTSEYISQYVTEKLKVSGYHTKFLHVNPSMWTYTDICGKILEYEAEGYEVHVCMVDYLLKVPTTGCDKGALGEDLRNMYERIRNFMISRNIAFITPHQISTEAKMLMRGGSTDFVKMLVGGGYYAGCKQIDQVVDLEIFIHIEKVNGSAYLTIQRGKHRKVGQTDEEYLYCVLPFHGKGCILDDINGADTTRKRPGGGAIGSGEDLTPFWESEI